MNGLKILVFGRSGQVSDELARVPRPDSVELDFLGLPEFDLTVESTRDAIGARRPDVVINAAAYTAVDRAESDVAIARRLNAEVVGEMAAAAREYFARFIHISTDYVFDGLKAAPYKEDDQPAPLCVYGRTKLEGEEEVRRAGGDWIIFRTAWVFSPIGSNFIKTMLRLAAERDEVSVVDDQHGRPTYAADIAALCLRAADEAKLAGLYHLCGADDASWADVAEHVFQKVEAKTGRRPKLKRISTAEYPTPARRPPNSRLDTSRLEQAANWRPRPWREAVDLCLAKLL